MRAKPPYWYWQLDRWNLLIAAGLTALTVVLALSGGGAPQAVVAPTPAPTVAEIPPTLDAPVVPTLGFADNQAALLAGKPSVVTGTAAPGARVQLFDGDTLLGETIADAKGVWAIDVPGLGPGVHALVVRATGVDGASVESVPLVVTLTPRAATPAAVTSPVVAPVAVPGIEIPAAGLAPAADTPLTLRGTAAPGAVVRIYDGDVLLGETTAGPDGVWQLELPGLAAGEHSLVVRTVAPDGTAVESAPLPVVVAPEAPVVTPILTPSVAPVVAPSISVPTADLTLAADTPGAVLSGAAAPGAVVRIYDGDALLGETVAGPDGVWQFVLPGLAPGDHTLVVRTTAPDGSVVESEPLRVAVAPRPAELADYPAPYLITLSPNQTIRVPVVGFCLNYGLPFPGSVLNPSDLLPDAVLKGLAYAVQRGYTESDLAQTQLAIWYLAEGRRIPERSYTIADEIIRFAESDAPTPEQGLTAPTLWEGIESRTVVARVIDFLPSQPRRAAYSGRGMLIIENLTGQTQSLVIPYGVRFSDARNTGVQDMAIFPAAK